MRDRSETRKVPAESQKTAFRGDPKKIQKVHPKWELSEKWAVYLVAWVLLPLKPATFAVLSEPLDHVEAAE